MTTTVYDTDGANFPISSTATVADAPLTLKYKYPVSATAGIPFTDPLIAFTDADPNGTAADYTSTIAWGDGQTSAGTISGSASAFYVNGTHTYAQGGTYTAVVTATDYGGSSVSASTQITAGGITASGVDLNYTANLASGNLDVANFTDSDGNGNSSMYTATIHWGDGTSSSGMVSGGFKVFGNHTYAQQGYYTITTAIVNGDGATATATSNANVERGVMTATSQLPTSSVSSLTFSGNVASVSDTDGDRTIGDYKASIAWGDGSSSAGTISCNGTVYVSGSHSYAASGSYPVTVTITKIDSSLATINGTLTMSPGSGPLTITTSSNLAGVKGTSFNGVVATFVDSDNNTNPYMYSATLVWGDGSSGTNGTIAYSSANHDFTITGSHIYAEAGTYTIGITLHDNDGASAGTGVSITIGDAALTATAHNLSATAGVPLSAVTAATFSDVDTSAPITDYSASINWGDNTPATAGSISGSGGSYTVTGGHLYAAVGNYTAVVTVTDAAGDIATASDTVTASAPASTLSVSPVSGTEGATFSGNVATFTPASGISGHTFVATLGWGDGGVTYGTLTSNGQGGYTISGTHTYAEETSSNNPETLTVTVLTRRPAWWRREAPSVTIADAALSATGQNVTAWIHQTTGSIAVATFTDANTAAPVSDFTASVNWGDGSGTSPATVEPTPGGAQGQFTVLAAHTYASTGNFTIQTSITDVGSSVANPTSTATVATPTTGSVAATAGSLSRAWWRASTPTRPTRSRRHHLG